MKRVLLKAVLATVPAVLILTCSIIYQTASAQDAPQATAKPSATPAPVVEEKKKPVILEKDKLIDLKDKEQRLETLKLQTRLAEVELDNFWLEFGIKRNELAGKWTGSQGVNGAIILTPVTEKPAPKAPEK